MVSGEACVKWHSDNECELVPEHPIVAVSIGASRIFSLLSNDKFDVGYLTSEISLNLSVEHGKKINLLFTYLTPSLFNVFLVLKVVPFQHNLHSDGRTKT